MEKCDPYTMVSVQKSYALYQAIKYTVANNIQGDFVECGVWKGGQTMLAAYTLAALGDQSRNLYLFDTFSGMPEPKPVDINIKDGHDAKSKWAKRKKSDHTDWCYASLQEVQDAMKITGYPGEKVHYIKGMVEDTIPSKILENIAILRLDTDWYDSTYHELHHCYGKITQGGVCIIDDYGIWEGSRKATDAYFKEIGQTPLLTKIGQNGRLILKNTQLCV